MSCGHSSLNHTLSVACEVPNDTWYFEIVPFQGWIPMSYKIFGSICKCFGSYFVINGLLANYFKT